MTNVIQNYANNIGQGITSMNNTTKKYYNNFSDVNSDSPLKPLDGKGYLVENSLINAPVEMAKDTYYTAKALKKGIAGKANDHELGKLNDLGLKVGGVAIATYLLSKRQTPKAMAMEFVGFGAFLASMAIWPKVALQWPAQLVHGFNFRKQYVDEQGRKKIAMQDPNYVPFDLYKGKRKSEDLAAIGDKMNISRNEKDRNDLVKERMRKVAVQNNTMWMMTAGVATPIMTALACNVAEKPIGNLLEKYSNNKVNKLAYEINSYMESPKEEFETKRLIPKMDTDAEKKLEGLLKSKKNQPINQSDIDQISEALTIGLDTKTQKAAHRDLTSMLSADKTVVNEDTVSNITKNLTEKLDSKYGEGYTQSIIDSKKLTEHVDNFMNTNGKPANGVLDAEKAEKLRLSIGDFIMDSTKDNTTIGVARRKAINNAALTSIDDAFASSRVAVLTDDAVGYISKAGKTIRKYRAMDETISGALHFKVEQAPETLAGNNWGRVTDKLIKELEITPKELNEAKNSEELTAELLTRKLETIAKDDAKYKKLVTNISEEMMKLDTALDNPTSGKKPVMDILKDGIAKNCDGTANELNSLAGDGSRPFQNLAERLSGQYVNGTFVGSVKDAKINRVKQTRIGGIQNAYMRLLHTVDFFKRANDIENGKATMSGDTALDKALIEKGKKVLVSSHSGDFYMKNQTANNVSFYKAFMWHVFGSGQMATATQEALNTPSHQVFVNGKTTMAQRVSQWAIHMKDLMGGAKNDFMPNHIEGVEPSSNYSKTAVEKFNHIASTPENLLYKALKQKYNSNKWMKTFTTIGGIVLAGTLASQFAFGKKDNTVQTTK